MTMNNKRSKILILLQHVYDCCDKKEVQRGMENLYTECYKLLWKDDLELLDFIIQKFELDHCHPIVGIGLLRASFLSKDQLPSWEILRNKLKKNVSNHRWMRGLL